MAIRTARRKSTKKTHKKTSSRSSARIVRTLSAVFLFVSLSLTLGVFLGLKFLNQRFASAESVSSYNLSEESAPVIAYVRINDFSSDPILVDSADIFLFDKTNKKILKMPISGTQKVNISGKFGEENFSKVFALGSLDAENKINAGIASVNNVLFQMYGLEIRKFVFVDSSKTAIFDSFFNSGNILPLLSPNLISTLGKSVITNVSLSEFYQLGQFIGGIPEDRFISLSSPDLSDDAVREIYFESDFAKHADTVAVLNGSSIPGMAAFGARVIRNLGGRVVAINNSDSVLRESMIVAEDPENFSVQTLARIFGIKKIISKENARSTVDNSEIDRADILLFFGFDKF